MKIKDITFTAAGTALFAALSMCLRIPVFDNYYLCLGYAVMTVYMWCFQWYEGAAVGFFGVILYCIAGSLGFNGMPGWAVGNIAIGLIFGTAVKRIRKTENSTARFFLAVLASAAAAFIGIGIIKSLIDSFVVSQPFSLRFIRNFPSACSDAFVIAASLPICLLVEKPAKKMRYE